MKRLASICITSYNQSQYVRDALRSAFAQTYTPLEIVICDDHSTDDTAKIIDEEVNAYRMSGGSHVVLVRRNEKNLGVAKNYDQCFRLAHGELLVTGGGDDNSLPDRVERLMAYWESEDCKPMAIIHDGYTINTRGVRVGTIGRRSPDFPLGAATAYNRKLFDFHFTYPDGVYEDHMLTPVAAMLGEVKRLDEKLIDYRVGCGMSTSSLRTARARAGRAGVAGHVQLLKDLESLRGMMSVDKYECWQECVRGWLVSSQAELDLFGGHDFHTRLNGFKVLRPKRLLSPLYFQYAVMTLPPVIADGIMKVYSFLVSILHSRQRRIACAVS